MGTIVKFRRAGGNRGGASAKSQSLLAVPLSLVDDAFDLG